MKTLDVTDAVLCCSDLSSCLRTSLWLHAGSAVTRQPSAVSPLQKFPSVPWDQFASNIWLMWEYKSLASSLQGESALKGHPSSSEELPGAELRPRWRPLWAQLFPLPSPAPSRRLTLIQEHSLLTSACSLLSLSLLLRGPQIWILGKLSSLFLTCY